MNININPKGPLAGVLTPTGEISGSGKPVRSKYFDGELPPENLIVPHGKLMAVLVLKDTGGSSTGGLVMPDTVVWSTPLMVVFAAGPNCQWTDRGDVVAVFPPIAERMEKVRIDGWEFLLVHEEQTQGTIPGLRIEPEEKLVPRV